MDRDYLIASASALVQPSPETAAEYEQVRESLAEAHSRHVGARPDLDRLIGPGNRGMMEDNSRNFCRFMGTMYSAYEPRVLVETVLWVFRAYRGHGFQTTYWPAHLNAFVEIAREGLGETAFNEIYPFLNWLITNIPVFVAITDEERNDQDMEEPSHG